MNIFAIEGDAETGQIDWEASARSQDNLRVVKMILESCQILSTVLNEQGMKAIDRCPKHILYVGCRVSQQHQPCSALSGND